MSDFHYGLQASLNGSIQSLSETVELHKTRADEAEGKLALISKRLHDSGMWESSSPYPPTAEFIAQAFAEAINDVHDILGTGTKIRVPV